MAIKEIAAGIPMPQKNSGDMSSTFYLLTLELSAIE